MDAIVAVYDDWGIGCNGDQPIALSADRKFFRNTTKGATVIVGRKTLEAFPQGKPLPKRRNLILSKSNLEVEGAEVVHSPEQALEASRKDDQVFVIGGGTVYRQMLDYCDRVYVTKVHIAPEADTWFENLDQSDIWEMTGILESGEENGIRYEMCLYERK